MGRCLYEPELDTVELLMVPTVQTMMSIAQDGNTIQSVSSFHISIQLEDMVVHHPSTVIPHKHPKTAKTIKNPRVQSINIMP